MGYIVSTSASIAVSIIGFYHDCCSPCHYQNRSHHRCSKGKLSVIVVFGDGMCWLFGTLTLTIREKNRWVKSL